MRYVSTRGGVEPKRFCEILLEGLAPDGGLFVPEYYPKVSREELRALRHAFNNGEEGGYARLAFHILSMYINDIPKAILQALCERTYTKEVFGTSAVTPVTRYDEGDGFHFHLHGLSNGPTLAFKDLALQLAGYLFEYVLSCRGEVLNVLGATSGDTGSAAEYALRDREGIQVFMLSPYGRMSPFQQAQMYGLQNKNVWNIAVEGNFDDAQAVVKAVSADAVFKKKYSIGAVNSINWARILAQIVYGFAGYFLSTTSNAEQRVVSVPSGNFGNAFAWHAARMMGLPISTIIIATNENDVLDEFFRTGLYRPRTRAETLETSSPSMDISLASNLERLIHAWFGAGWTYSLYVNQLPRDGQFDLKEVALFQDTLKSKAFVSGKSTHADRIQVIREVYEKHGIILDPHTADAWGVADRNLHFYGSVIVLETAQAVKFENTIVEAIGHPAPVPEHLQGIEAMPRRVVVLPPDAEVIKKFIADRCA